LLFNEAIRATRYFKAQAPAKLTTFHSKSFSIKNLHPDAVGGVASRTADVPPKKYNRALKLNKKKKCGIIDFKTFFSTFFLLVSLKLLLKKFHNDGKTFFSKNVSGDIRN